MRLSNEHGETWEPGCSCRSCWFRRLMDWHGTERQAVRGRTMSGVLPQVVGCAAVLLVFAVTFFLSVALYLLWSMVGG